MLNFQGEFEERCHSIRAPTYLSFFTAVWSNICLLLNIPGNVLVIIAVLLDPFKNLRTPFNYLMASLACADLLVGIVTEPISVSTHIKEGLGESIPLKEVQALHLSYFISCTASVLSLGTLAIERYLAISIPHTYRSKLTGKRILATIVGIWTISLTIPMLYFEVGFITYAFIFANTALLVVTIITFFTYVMMLRRFRERKMNFVRRSSQISPCPSTSDTQTTVTSVSRNASVIDSPYTASPTRETADIAHIPKESFALPTKNSVHSSCEALEQKVTKMFLVVLVAILCCYAPSTIFIYVMSFCKTCSCLTLHWFRDLQFLFVIANSGMNFYCYSLRSPRFRKAFLHILRMEGQQNN